MPESPWSETNIPFLWPGFLYNPVNVGTYFISYVSGYLINWIQAVFIREFMPRNHSCYQKLIPNIT